MLERHPPLASSSHSRWQRFRRLQWAYFVLAAFVLLAVSLGLFLIDRIGDLHVESVRINHAWGQRLEQFAELPKLAAEVNAPGNDVFDTNDTRRESARLEERHNAFNARLQHLQIEILRNVPRAAANELLTGFENVQASMDGMVEHARLTLNAFEQGDRVRAGRHMADMDKQHHAVIDNMVALGRLVQQQQLSESNRQTASALQWQQMDVPVAGLFILMVFGVTAYGIALSRKMREAGWMAEEHLHLSQRMAAVGTVAAGLGHDMGNLLFPLRAHVDVLAANSNASKSARESIASIQTLTSYIESLVRGLRSLVRDERGRGDARFAGDAKAWLADAQSLIRSSLPRALPVAWHCEDGVRLPDVPTHRLTQALLNLLHNARDAVTQAHQDVRHGRIDVTIRHEPEGGMRLVVADNGAGMTEEVRRRCVQPFFTTKRNSSGTGLGLSMVQDVVLDAKGALEIESEPGNGTTINLIFPSSAINGAIHGAMNGAMKESLPSQEPMAKVSSRQNEHAA